MFQRPLSLIIYVAENEMSAEVHHFIQSQSRHEAVEVLRSIDSLCGRIRCNGKKDVIAILLITSRQELEAIVQQGDLLCDHKVILVLPDRSQYTASIGHSLYPRYIGYLDGGLDDVTWVLNKMVQQDHRYTLSIKTILNKFITKGATHDRAK